ncbi:MAG TPA: hypothetical protein VH370_01725 [Humisphaera sp.]|jgi:hypothetical protein|nr:hypothetical protein [Humisphaera sp.]
MWKTLVVLAIVSGIAGLFGFAIAIVEDFMEGRWRFKPPRNRRRGFPIEPNEQPPEFPIQPTEPKE